MTTYGQNRDAGGNGLPTPARHGQNERVMVLNRKNALFAGHDLGAENWACIASLIETCKLNDVDPQVYFTDVLTKLVNLWPASRIDELMPWAWAAEHSTSKLAA
jgi:transposase